MMGSRARATCLPRRGRETRKESASQSSRSGTSDDPISQAADAGLGLPLVLCRLHEISAGVQARAEEVAGALTRPGIDPDVPAGLAEMIAG